VLSTFFLPTAAGASSTTGAHAYRINAEEWCLLMLTLLIWDNARLLLMSAFLFYSNILIRKRWAWVVQIHSAMLGFLALPLQTSFRL